MPDRVSAERIARWRRQIAAERKRIDAYNRGEDWLEPPSIGVNMSTLEKLLDEIEESRSK